MPEQSVSDREMSVGDPSAARMLNWLNPWGVGLRTLARSTFPSTSLVAGLPANDGSVWHETDIDLHAQAGYTGVTLGVQSDRGEPER